MTAKKKIQRFFFACGIVFTLLAGGCSSSENTFEDSSLQLTEGTYHDMANWTAYQEITDSTLTWSVCGYWDDLVTAAGAEQTQRYTAADGQLFYILTENVESGELAGNTYALTQVDMANLEQLTRKLDFRNSEKLTGQEAAELTALTEAMEQAQASLLGIDALDGKVNLYLCHWTDDKAAGIYSLQLDEDLHVTAVTDLLPSLKLAFDLQENVIPVDFVRDNAGNFFVTVHGNDGGICLLDENGAFVSRTDATEKANSIFSCTGKLSDGRPVFEIFSPETETLTLLCFDGGDERILYHGLGQTAKTRYIAESGEIIWLDYSGLLRWNAVEGTCERFYQDGSLEPSNCEAVWESSHGEITFICYDEGVTSLYQLTDKEVEKVRVRIFTFFDDSEMKKHAAEYSRTHPDIELTVETNESGASSEILLNKIMSQMTSGKGPDILIVNRTQLETLKKGKALADLSEAIPEDVKKQIFEGVLQQGMIDDGLYGVAREVSLSTLLVPDQIWAEESWRTTDVLNLLGNHERMGEPYDRWISLNSSLTADQMLFDLAVINVGGNGSWPVDEEQGKCYFNTPEFIQVLEACKKYGEVSGSRGHMTDEECMAEIEEGKAFAFPVDGGLQQFSRCLAMCGEGWHCVGYPTDSGCGSRVTCYQLAAVNARTIHYEIAADFLGFLLSKEVQQKDIGSATVRKDVLTESVVENHPAYEGAPVFLWGQNVILLEGKADGTSYLTEYLKLLDEGKPENWWRTEVRGIIMEEADAFFNSARSAADAAEIIQNRVQIYLDENR